MARRSRKKKSRLSGPYQAHRLRIKSAVEDNNDIPTNGASRTLNKSQSSLRRYKELLLNESGAKASNAESYLTHGDLPQPTHLRFDYDDMEHFAPRALQLQSLMQDESGGLRTYEAANGLCPLIFELLRTATELKHSELEACLALIEKTSGDDYRASSMGWHPSNKKAEMLDKEMIYLLVRQGEVTEVNEGQQALDTGTKENSPASLVDLNQMVQGNAAASGVDGTVKPAATATPTSFANNQPTYAEAQSTNRCEWLYMRSNGDILGFISFMFTYDDPPNDDREVVYIYEIHLHERLRGHGLGSKLISFVEDAAGRCGIDKTMLTVFTANKGARALYEKLGYSKDECSPNDRIMRSKIVQADYMIMSKKIPLGG